MWYELWGENTAKATPAEYTYWAGEEKAYAGPACP